MLSTTHTGKLIDRGKDSLTRRPVRKSNIVPQRRFQNLVKHLECFAKIVSH